MMVTRLLKMLLLGLMVSAIWVLLPSAKENVEACGGFFCSNTPIDQNAERIIFTVNGDGTITAIVGINYVGDAEDFSWVVPVPSPPEVDVADQDIFLRLQGATNPQVIYPENHCAGLTAIPCCGGGGGDGVIQGQIGPYDYAIISGDNPDALITWLRENNYQVTEAMEPIIADYVDAGMYFLAMRLSQDAEVGDIQPIVMTYESENPMIPIKLTAIAAVENMPIYVWIFGETQYVPQNFAHEAIDYTVVRNRHAVLSMGLERGAIALTNSYFTQIAQIQSEYDGKMFITDYAGTTAQLLATPNERIDRFSSTSSVRNLIENDATLSDLFETFPYVTRLYGQMSPNQMTLDPVFIPDESAPNVSNIVDFRGLVPPLEFWGCSTRTIGDDIDETLVPNTMYSDEWNVDIAYPDGWVLSEIELVRSSDGQGFAPAVSRVWVFSPQSVTQDDVRAYFEGNDTPPMFIVTESSPDTQVNYETWRGISSRNIRQLLYHPHDDTVDQTTPPIQLTGYRPLHPSESVNFWFASRDLLVFAMLTDAEDFAANNETYTAIMRSAERRDYFLHPDLRHTLYLTGNTDADISFSDTLVQIPYPDGWLDQVMENGDILIAPESFEASDHPQVRIVPYESHLEFDERYEWYQQTWRDIRTTEEWQLVLDFVEAEYGITLTIDEGNSILQFADETFTFETESRRGYLRFTHGYVIELSAPLASFEEYEAVLTLIENTMTSR